MNCANKPALVWKNISISHPFGDLILDDISGYANFGTMTAIMGPSGAGKTSLLRCLFGTSNLAFDGSIFVSDLDTKAVFITQNVDEHLYMHLTVQESLFYSQRFKTTMKNNGKRVTDLVNQLGLVSCRNNLVKNCSGGQKKRLAIAQELTSDRMPGIVLIDEPTSGLDSRASMTLMKYLQQLSNKFEIAILATMHQPSYMLLRRFDKVYILSKFSFCLLFDDPLKMKSLVSKLQLNTTVSFNPADICMEAASVCPNTEFDKNGDKRHNFDHNSRKILQFSRDLKEETERKIIEDFNSKINLNTMFKRSKLCANNKIWSFCHFYYLFNRDFTNNVIRRKDFWLRIIIYIALCFLMIGVFGNIGERTDGCSLVVDKDVLIEQMTCYQAHKEEYVYRNAWLNAAFLFLTFIFIGLESTISSSFLLDTLKVFVSEHRNGWYSTSSFLVARSLIDTLTQTFLTYMASILLYYISKQDGLSTLYDLIPIYYVSRFNLYTTVMVLCCLVNQAIGFSISLFVDSTRKAIMISFGILVISILQSSFINGFRSTSIQKYFVLRPAFEGMITAVYLNRCNNNTLIALENERKSQIENLYRSSVNSLGLPFVPSFNLISNQVIPPENVTVMNWGLGAHGLAELPIDNIVHQLLLHLSFWKILPLILLWIKTSNLHLFQKFSVVTRKKILNI